MLAIAACTTMFLGACGDDDDDEATDDTDAPAAATDAPAAATDAPAATTMAPATTIAADTTMAADNTMAAETTMASETTEAPDSSAAPDTTGGGGASGGDGFCGAYVDLTLAFSAEGEPDTEALTATLDEADADVPDQVADDWTTMSEAARSVLETGDFAAFEDPSFGEAQSVVDPYVFENCEFDNTVEVSAIDYGYEGLPAELPAGRTAILMTNDGVEAHEIVFFRKNDGVTQSFAEILELEEEEAGELVTEAGGAFAASNGAAGLGIVDLEPGEYIAVCFIPVGTMIDGQEFTEGSGPPHFVEGMQVEFTVA